MNDTVNTVKLNPFTPSSGQSKYLRKIPNFIFANSAKQIAPCESTAKEISFEWSHYRILSTDSEFRTTLDVSIIDSGSEKVEDIIKLELPSMSVK